MRKIISAILMMIAVIALAACDMQIEEAKIVFNNDDNLYSTIYTNGMEKIVLPQEPTKNGYDFSGWFFHDGEELLETTYEKKILTGDAAVDAKWEAINYNITYELDGGTTTNAATYTINDTITLGNPTKDGYIFKGWTSDDYLLPYSGITIAQGSTGDKKFVANWERENVGVTFNTNCETKIQTKIIDSNTTIEAPTLTREHYEFLGWYLDNQLFDFTKPITASVVLEAKWKAEEYEVTFNSGYEEEIDTQEIAYNGLAVEPKPTREHYNFLGWYLGEELFDFTKPIQKDIDLVAKWEVTEYTVSFTTNCSKVVFDQEVAYGETADVPTITRDYYELLGWYLDDELYDFTKPISQPINLIAKWQAITYYISFPNGECETIPYTYEDRVVIENLSEEGKYFLGWNYNQELVKNLVIEDTGTDIELESEWSDIVYVVTYDYGNTTDVDYVSYGDKIVTLPTTTNLLGWYLDLNSSEFDSNTPIINDIILYAKLSSMRKYEFSYNDSVTSSISNNSNIYDGTEVEVSTPLYYDDKIFDGWYNEDTLLANTLSFSFDMPARNYSIEAKYRDITVITYDKSSNENLEFAYEDAHAVYGQNIADNYEIDGNNVVISKSYLINLEVGYYCYLMCDVDDNMQEFYIEVINTNNTINYAYLDYDLNYPNVTLYFDEGIGEHQYKIDDGSYITCTNGTIIEGYDKTTSHTITVKNVNNEYSFTKNGYTTANKKYYTETFTYGGNTYDYYMDDKDEYMIFMRYVLQVAVPNSSSGSISISYLKNNTFTADNNNLDEYMYLTNAAYDYSTRYTINTLYVTASGEFNTLKTYQEATILTDYTLEKGNRPEYYDDFFIEKQTKTQEIRSIYELEDLDFGIKPIIMDDRALEVYEKAKEILRTYVDDSMSDYEKVRVMYDWLAINVVYDDVLLEFIERVSAGEYACFTSYGALINNVAVCDGYASAFKLLCSIEGIKCVEIMGFSGDVGHAWNKVCIDGVWYGVDSTWARVTYNNNEYINHEYLFINEKGLYCSDHWEGASNEIWHDVVHTADTPFNYYKMIVYNGIDLYNPTSIELNQLKAYYEEKGVKVFDVYYTGYGGYSMPILTN